MSLLLHVLWLTRYELIYIKVLDKVEVEEYHDLKNKLEEVLELDIYQHLANVNQINILIQVTKLIAIQIKRLLFNFYSIIKDYNSYNLLNNNTMYFKQMREKEVSLVDIKVRNQIFDNN